MKKLTALILPLIFMFTLVGCGEQNQEVKPGTQHYFTAKVIAVNEEYLLIEVTDSCNSNLSVGATVEVSTEVMSADGCPDFVIDEYARVSLAQNIENDPPGRLEAFSIYKTDETGNIIAD